jgi:hypothetical protein
MSLQQLIDLVLSPFLSIYDMITWPGLAWLGYQTVLLIGDTVILSG